MEKLLLSGIAQKKEPCITTFIRSIFLLQCVFKSPYTEKDHNISYHCNVSAFLTTAQHLLYISARKCQCVRHSCKIHKGYTNLLPTTVWEAALLLPLLAFIVQRRNPSKAAKWYDWEIMHHLWGSSSYLESFGWCPGMMHRSRPFPCRVLTAPLICVLAASGINASLSVSLYKIGGINKWGAISLSLPFLLTNFCLCLASKPI